MKWEEEKHEQWLVDQYNRNRAFEDQVKDFAEYNRKMLDLEINKINNNNEIVSLGSMVKCGTSILGMNL